MRTLLLIMNPRTIAECLYSMRHLDGVDRAWMQGYCEHGLVDVIAGIVGDTDYDRYAIIADDAVVSQRALDAVLEHHATMPDGAVSGWSNVDASSDLSNVMTSDLVAKVPRSTHDYDLLTIDEVRAAPAPFRARFSGLALHVMSRELWQRYPFAVFGGSPGWASDYHLSRRLQEDDVPLVVHPRGEVHHVKETWNRMDDDPRKKLQVGARHERVVYDIV